MSRHRRTRDVGEMSRHRRTRRVVSIVSGGSDARSDARLSVSLGVDAFRLERAVGRGARLRLGGEGSRGSAHGVVRAGKADASREGVDVAERVGRGWMERARTRRGIRGVRRRRGADRRRRRRVGRVVTVVSARGSPRPELSVERAAATGHVRVPRARLAHATRVLSSGAGAGHPRIANGRPTVHAADDTRAEARPSARRARGCRTRYRPRREKASSNPRDPDCAREEEATVGGRRRTGTSQGTVRAEIFCWSIINWVPSFWCSVFTRGLGSIAPSPLVRVTPRAPTRLLFTPFVFSTDRLARAGRRN